MTGRITDRDFAVALARWLVGLMFFMAGVHKVFVMGAATHARQLFVEPYAESFLPAWSLWATGSTVPFVELIAGAAMVLGLGTRYAAYLLGGVLVLVTFGHALADPFFAFHTHVMPRALLLVFVLAVRDGPDPLSADRWVHRGPTG